ncbi:hypothetical protein DET55_10956 [Bacillus mycoides]|uniref:Phosphatidic acid phosphatase type 2/haloperoxidase domain-containing protein n=1 Tax=Bacillus mycoides TaxID=1405 RepID=A0A3D9UY16_BACMY|nr:hypothetical protein DET63_11356 [Bacillus sp. DB-2]REF34412.1 hypothetical protein DET55_10956 [Bacillus mycoides]
MGNRKVILISSFAILLCIFAFTDLQISNSLYEPTNKILVPMSRIVVGAHFASDVTVGVAISVTVFMCLKKFIWIDTKYLPLGLRRIVACKIRPSTSRLLAKRTRPSFGNFIVLPTIPIFPFVCLVV